MEFLNIEDWSKIRVPGDDACLLHCLSRWLRTHRGIYTTGQVLRQRTAQYIHDSPDIPFGDVPLRTWILWDMGRPRMKYVRQLRRESFWGGSGEMSVLSLIHQMSVTVYYIDPGQPTLYRRREVFDR